MLLQHKKLPIYSKLVKLKYQRNFNICVYFQKWKIKLSAIIFIHNINNFVNTIKEKSLSSLANSACIFQTLRYAFILCQFYSESVFPNKIINNKINKTTKMSTQNYLIIDVFFFSLEIWHNQTSTVYNVSTAEQQFHM